MGQPWAGGLCECRGIWGGSQWAGPHCRLHVGREGQGPEGKGQVVPELFTGQCPAGGFGASLPATGTEPSHSGQENEEEDVPRASFEAGVAQGRPRVCLTQAWTPPHHRLLQPPPHWAWPGMGGVKLPRAPWHVVPPRTSGSPPPLLFFPFCLFSFLINHTLLPNLNMEMPRPGKAIIPPARRAVRAGPGLRGAWWHRPLSGVCEITCTKGVSSSECVN